MTQTVTNISAYVSILSSLIMGRRVRGGGDGVIEAVVAATGNSPGLSPAAGICPGVIHHLAPPLPSPTIPRHLQPLPPNPLRSPSPK